MEPAPDGATMSPRPLTRVIVVAAALLLADLLTAGVLGPADPEADVEISDGETLRQQLVRAASAYSPRASAASSLRPRCARTPAMFFRMRMLSGARRRSSR